MPDYQAMYAKLFRSQTAAILLLQEAQQATEEMYIESEPVELKLFPRQPDDENAKPETPENDDK